MTPDVLLVDDFLPEAEELFVELQNSVQWDTRMAARYTASFGTPYNYSQMTYEARPMHQLLVPITYRSKLNHEIKHTFRLQSGSMHYMDSAVQEKWMHAVKKEKEAGPRISLTWRAFQ